MFKIHFIGVEGEIMSQLAVALHRRANYLVSGSGDTFPQHILERFKGAKLSRVGNWDSEKISKQISSVVVSKTVSNDNPELLRAIELKLKIFSMSEFLYYLTRSKTRIVVAGCPGKTIVSGIITDVLEVLKIKTDYLLNEEQDINQKKINLSYESMIAVFQEDSSIENDLNRSRAFLNYKPHIVVFTCDSKNTDYVINKKELYQELISGMEAQGRVVFLKNSTSVNAIIHNLRRDVVLLPFELPEYTHLNEGIRLKVRNKEYDLKIQNPENLHLIENAHYCCKQIGVSDEKFYTALRNVSLNF